jgi:hypothetical protein
VCVVLLPLRKEERDLQMANQMRSGLRYAMCYWRLGSVDVGGDRAGNCILEAFALRIHLLPLACGMVRICAEYTQTNASASFGRNW